MSLLTVLNYSGGQQSSAILWMVLLGEIEKPKHFLVLNADPGMENSRTYEYNKLMFSRCAEAGIEAVTVPGPNLYKDLLNHKTKSRLDNPPYWTKSPTGKKGRLLQKCTQTYKIAPMDRYIRKVLERDFEISHKSKRLPKKCVQKWIGLAWDEVFRMSNPKQGYIEFVYPLIDMQLTREDTRKFFITRELPIPPRSVCNACFANGLQTFFEMRRDRPDDWVQAVAVDKAVRNCKNLGIHDEVYVSSTLQPLLELDDLDTEDKDNYSCDSGYCFT